MSANYHDRPELSSSQLKLVATKTLAHYWADYVDPARPARTETDAMRLGTELHMLLLEPGRFATEYVCDSTPADAPRRPTEKQLASLMDPPPKAGTKARAERERIEEAAAFWRQWDQDHPIPPNATVLSADRWATLQGMANGLAANSMIAKILESDGIAETPIIWDDPVMGPCRCMPDWLTNDDWILDIKSAVTANPRRFRWQAWDLGYDIQQWFYLRGLAAIGRVPRRFVFATVEKTRPFVAVPFAGSDEWTRSGEQRGLAAFAALQEAKASGSWPGWCPSGEFATLAPPGVGDQPPADPSIDFY